MSPDEYRSIIKSLETHYEEFKRNSQKSELFGDEDKKMIEKQYTTAQTHYDKMIIQLPTYSESCTMYLVIVCGFYRFSWIFRNPHYRNIIETVEQPIINQLM